MPPSIATFFTKTTPKAAPAAAVAVEQPTVLIPAPISPRPSTPRGEATSPSKRQEAHHPLGSPKSGPVEQPPAVIAAKELRQLMDQHFSSELLGESACNLMLDPQFPPGLVPRFMELMRGFARAAGTGSTALPALHSSCSSTSTSCTPSTPPATTATPASSSASSSSSSSSLSSSSMPPPASRSSSSSSSGDNNNNSNNSNNSGSEGSTSPFQVPAPRKVEPAKVVGPDAPLLEASLWVAKGINFLSPRGKFNLHATAHEVVLAADNQASLLRFPIHAAGCVLQLADWNQRDMMLVIPLKTPAAAAKSVISVIIIKIGAAVAFAESAVSWGGAVSGEFKEKVQTAFNEQVLKAAEEKANDDSKQSKAKNATAGKLCDFMAILLSNTLNLSIGRASPGVFQAFNKKSAGIQSYVRASPGSLYFVEEGVLSLNKPAPNFFPVDEIDSISTSRASQRFINITLETKSDTYGYEMVAGEELEGVASYARLIQSNKRMTGKRKGHVFDVPAAKRVDRPPRREAAIHASQYTVSSGSDSSSSDEEFNVAGGEEGDDSDDEGDEGDEGDEDVEHCDANSSEDEFTAPVSDNAT